MFCRLIGRALGAATFGGVLNTGLTRAGPGAQDAVWDLTEPMHRLALKLDKLAEVTGVPATAVHGMFLMAAGVAVLTLLIMLLAPRRARPPNA